MYGVQLGLFFFRQQNRKGKYNPGREVAAGFSFVKVFGFFTNTICIHMTMTFCVSRLGIRQSVASIVLCSTDVIL